MELVKTHKCFGGEQRYYSHTSDTTFTKMNFSLFLPEQTDKPVPLIYWLSGLTCTEENFTVKSGFQRYANALGVAVVAPDTSPRGCDIEGEDDSYDFGSGAGFYVDATQKPWSTNYNMYNYIVDELPGLVESQFKFSGKRSIMGHSMGGHGALMIALRNHDQYQSVSAFAPIVAPSAVPWGQKAFAGYLGDDRSSWSQYDSLALLESGSRLRPCLIDQGAADNFLQEQLQPERFVEAANARDFQVEYRLHEGYDHSYFFIASFICDHLEFHKKHLHD